MVSKHVWRNSAYNISSSDVRARFILTLNKAGDKFRTFPRNAVPPPA